MTDDIESRARDLAKRLHTDQLYGERPYFTHLHAVVRVLKRFDITEPHILAAGWLHDALEDTRLAASELSRHRFPPETDMIVIACTDGDGDNRAERKQRSYAMIAKTPNAVLVKVADRIANVEASIMHGPRNVLEMYRHEHRDFRAALAAAPASHPVGPMWAYLDGMFFGTSRWA